LVETTVSTFVGVASGIALTFFLVSNPVGWAIAIGLSVGAAVGSYGTGKAFAKIYSSTWLKEHDLVAMTNVDELCN